MTVAPDEAARDLLSSEERAIWSRMADHAMARFGDQMAAKIAHYEARHPGLSGAAKTAIIQLAVENAVLMDVMKAMSARVTALEEDLTRP